MNGYPNHWLSPYTILEKVYFWREIDYDEPNIKRWNKILTPFCEALQLVRKVINPEIRYVKIDHYDTWSMDHTLAPIILPLLKQLKEQKCGYGWVEDTDVPDNLKSTADGVTKEENCWDSNAQARYEWIIDEMIFAFECLVDDSWEDKFRSGEMDIVWETCEDTPNFKRMGHGPNHTYECDYEGMKVVQARISNGLRLFGVYFQSLWT